MSKHLKFSDDLLLPLDAATQTFAFIARKGAGKTYAAGKLAELLIDAGVQVVVLDTVGNWYGLRIAADGKGAGLDIPVIGGLRGDVPLASESGHLIADLVVDTGRSLVIDLSQFSLGDRKRFATAFGEQLWKRKKGQADPTPVHMIIEESQLIIPQFVGRDEARMVGIFEEIVRLGRNYGIGVSMITQRPQSVNKEVLTQTEALVVGQVNGVPERKALKEWIVQQGADVKLADELPGLHVGTMYVWSPQWLRILQKIKVAPKRTFDASSTPKVGETRRSSADLKPINLDELKAKMAATIEKAKADDPRELRRQIADLQKQLNTKASAPVQPKVVEKPVVTDAQVSRVETIIGRMEKEGQRRIEAGEKLAASGQELIETGKAFAVALGRASKNQGNFITNPITTRVSAQPMRPIHNPVHNPPGKAQAQPSPGTPVGDGTITPRQQRFLDAAATLSTLNVEVSKETVAAWLGIHPRGGSVGEELKALQDAGLFVVDRGRITVTEAGMTQAVQLDPATAIESAKAGLEPRQRRIFDIVVTAYPGEITKEAVAEQMGIHPRGGSFGEDISALRGRGLIDSSRGVLRARDFLFAVG